MRHRYLFLIWIGCLAACLPLSGLQAQCTNQVMHTTGSAIVAGVNVTVTTSGNTCAWTTYCPTVTQPFFIGYAPGPGSGPGQFTFNFSPSISGIRLNFSGASNSPPSVEEIRLQINGAHYAMSAPGVANGCDPMASLTGAGDLVGCPGCGVSGWSNTSISGFPISSLTVEDFVVGGTPNGSLFSLFICNAFLPTEWLHFDAKVNSTEGVDLLWTTATEINNDFFTVERSADGVQWEEIAEVDAVGNSEVASEYRLSDEKPLADRSSYRIRQTSLDGSSSYSEVKEVNFDAVPEILIYPNPAKEVLHVEWQNFKGNPTADLQLQLRNPLGQTVNVAYSTVSGGLLLQTSDLSSGVYILEIRNTQGVFIKRFTVE
ncbi:MAG: T9SS type A sorting domain-containing protein [Bacteroidetes bacterium]|nr:T9SS type A sorting domain-containing protein [Bacteroidota bacterium]